MRNARNFNPEWGYIASAPSVVRTDCLIVLAAIIFATAGVATVFSLLHRPVGEELVAAPTLVAPEVRAGACGLPPIFLRAGLGRFTVRE